MNLPSNLPLLKWPCSWGSRKRRKLTAASSLLPVRNPHLGLSSPLLREGWGSPTRLAAPGEEGNLLGTQTQVWIHDKLASHKTMLAWRSLHRPFFVSLEARNAGENKQYLVVRRFRMNGSKKVSLGHWREGLKGSSCLNSPLNSHEFFSQVEIPFTWNSRCSVRAYYVTTLSSEAPAGSHQMPRADPCRQESIASPGQSESSWTRSQETLAMRSAAKLRGRQGCRRQQIVFFLGLQLCFTHSFHELQWSGQ